MRIDGIGSFTEYDTVHRRDAWDHDRQAKDQAADREIVLAERRTTRPAELQLTRVRRVNTATGHTDIYL